MSINKEFLERAYHLQQTVNLGLTRCFEGTLGYKVNKDKKITYSQRREIKEAIKLKNNIKELAEVMTIFKIAANQEKNEKRKAK